MHIRLLTAQDGSQFQKLRLEALQENPEAFLATFDNESSRHEDSFSQELDAVYAPPHFGFWGMFDDEDQLVAFCRITSSYLPKQLHIVSLFSLYVTPNARHQGRAKELLDHITAELKKAGIEQVYLTVISGNQPALELYLKYGFEQCGTRPQSVKWQGQYFDEIEMRLRLL